MKSGLTGTFDVRRPPRLPLHRGRVVIATTCVVLLVVAWQLYAPRSGAVFELPTPVSTWRAALKMARSGELWRAMTASGAVFLAGTLLGIAGGILVGVVIGAVRPLDTAFSPYMFAFYATPFVALIPLLVLLFGVWTIGKIVVVFTLVWPAVVIQTTAGVRDVDARFLEVANSFGSPWLRTLLQVRLPASMSLIVAGIRLAVGRALVGVIIAEFATVFNGLGAEIFIHSRRFQLASALVPAIVLAVFGIVLTAALRRAESRLERWRGQE